MRTSFQLCIATLIMCVLTLTGYGEIVTIRGSSTPIKTSEPAAPRISTERTSTPREFSYPEWFSSDLLASKYEDERWSDWDHDDAPGFDHVEIGTRIITYELQDDHRSLDAEGNGFIGTISDLEPIDDSSPNKVFIDYFVTPYWGFEISYDEIGAETKTDPSRPFGVKSDGDLEMSGPIISLMGRYPNQTAFTPYGGAGFALYSSDFKEEAHWALGYANPAAYEAAGSPSTPLGNRTRTMNVDDAMGLVVYGGALWSVHKDWAIDLYVRYMDVEVDTEFIGAVGDNIETRREGTFTMEHVGYGVSLHYIF